MRKQQAAAALSHQTKKTYQCTRKTYRFRIYLPHEDVCSIEDLDGFFSQSLADLCDRKYEDGFVGP